MLSSRLGKIAKSVAFPALATVFLGLMLTLHLLCRSGAKESDLIVQHLDA
jgi:hypothetical protein